MAALPPGGHAEGGILTGNTNPHKEPTAGLADALQSGDSDGVSSRPHSQDIKSPVLIPIEESFRRNMQDLGSLQAMPGLMVGFIEVVRKLLSIAIDNVITVSVEKASPEVALRRFVDELGAYPGSLRQPGSANSDELRSGAKARLLELCQHPNYGPILTSGLKVLRRTAVLSGWTAFECVAADAWKAVLNENPVPLGQRALASVREKEDGDLSAKHISVGLAARHGFDLRHSLGTLLESKFDFTSVDGIKKAFGAAFGSTGNSAELLSILSGPKLRELQATRNLIVHRAGVVDGEYNRLMCLDLPVGEPLELTEERVSELVESAGVASGAILIFLDNWLEKPDAAAVSSS